MPEMISIIWHYEDVLHQAEEDGHILSYKDACIILDRIDRNHDASIGVNWDVISIYIDEYLEEKNERDN